MLQNLIEQEEELNLLISKKISVKFNKKPVVAIINANREDEPSKRYINSKRKNLEDNSISTYLFYVNNNDNLVKQIEVLNENEEIDFIIVQSPFSSNITLNQQLVFDLIAKEKDIDRLRSDFYYDKDYKNLPLTACGMYKLIHKIKNKRKLLFIGNGITTNKRLFLKMFDEGIFDCRIVNSKTPVDSMKELINWSEIIVSSTGIPEILKCENKIVISPTICKTEDGFKSDLNSSYYILNETHKKIGGIGKLTISELIRRVWEDYEIKKMEVTK